MAACDDTTANLPYTSNVSDQFSFTIRTVKNAFRRKPFRLVFYVFERFGLFVLKRRLVNKSHEQWTRATKSTLKSLSEGSNVISKRPLRATLDVFVTAFNV